MATLGDYGPFVFLYALPAVLTAVAAWRAGMPAGDVALAGIGWPVFWLVTLLAR